MVNHPKIPGLTVAIVVDHHDLVEHVDQYASAADPDCVTRYVETQPGKTYKIRLRFDETCTALFEGSELEARVTVDGTHILTPKFHREYFRNGVLEKKVKGLWEPCAGGSTLQRFVFQTLALGDIQFVSIVVVFAHRDADADTRGDSSSVGKFAELGEIKIEIRRAYIRRSNNTARASNKQIQSTSSVPEKKLKGKAISLSTGFGEKTFSRKAIHECTKTLIDKEPYITFKFRYRSHADLQAEMIIPRDDPPVAESNDLRRLSGVPDLPKTQIKQERKRPLSLEAPAITNGDDGDDDVTFLGSSTMTATGELRRKRKALMIDLT